MRLRKRQSWTITYERGGRVVVTDSEGAYFELSPGDQRVIDATLVLEPLEIGWEVVP